MRPCRAASIDYAAGIPQTRLVSIMRSIPLDPECLELRGALEVDVSESGLHPRRLPSWTWPRMAGPFLPIVVPMGSGVRLVLSTDADVIELDAKLRTFMFLGDPYRELRFDLVVDGVEVATADAPEADALVFDRSDPGNTVLEERGVTTVRFEGLRARGSGGMSTVEIWVPQAAEVELRALRVDDGAVVGRAPAAAGPRWVHYGSSISHCMEAETARLGTWPVVAATASRVGPGEPRVRRSVPSRPVRRAHDPRPATRPT